MNGRKWTPLFSSAFKKLARVGLGACLIGVVQACSDNNKSLRGQSNGDGKPGVIEGAPQEIRNKPKEYHVTEYTPTLPTANFENPVIKMKGSLPIASGLMSMRDTQLSLKDGSFQFSGELTLKFIDATSKKEVIAFRDRIELVSSDDTSDGEATLLPNESTRGRIQDTLRLGGKVFCLNPLPDGSLSCEKNFVDLYAKYKGQFYKLQIESTQGIGDDKVRSDAEELDSAEAEAQKNLTPEILAENKEFDEAHEGMNDEPLGEYVGPTEAEIRELLSDKMLRGVKEKKPPQNPTVESNENFQGPEEPTPPESAVPGKEPTPPPAQQPAQPMETPRAQQPAEPEEAPPAQQPAEPEEAPQAQQPAEPEEAPQVQPLPDEGRPPVVSSGTEVTSEPTVEPTVVPTTKPTGELSDAKTEDPPQTEDENEVDESAEGISTPVTTSNPVDTHRKTMNFPFLANTKPLAKLPPEDVLRDLYGTANSTRPNRWGDKLRPCTSDQICNAQLSARPQDQAIGHAASGSLRNASSLLEKVSELGNRGRIHLPRQDRKSYFGTYELVQLISVMAKKLFSLSPNTPMWIHDLSGSKGRIPGTSHKSHANGTDADIAYILSDDSGASHFRNIVNGGRARDLDISTQWKMFKYTVSTGWVDRIFVDPAVKREMCQFTSTLQESGIEREWTKVTLKRLIHRYTSGPLVTGHNNHFHMRIACSSVQRLCRNMVDPPEASCPR